MKTEEDEAFDELAKRQGDWGSGFTAKRQAAADKLHWSDCAVHNGPAYPAGKCDCGVARDADANATVIQYHEATIKRLEKRIEELLAQPAQGPYDQTALELCEVCGWKTLIPDDGCLNCERAQPAQEPVALVIDGVLVKSALPEKYTGHLYTTPPKRE